MRKYIFWGFTLISTGILWLLKSYGIVYFSLYDVFKLWPVILIWIGIGVLPVKDIIKIILDIVTLILLILILLFPIHKREHHRIIIEKELRTNTIIESTVTQDSINSIAFLDFSAGAAKINFFVGDFSKLIDIQSSGGDNKNVTVENVILNDKSNIKVKINDKKIKINDSQYSVYLNPNPIWNINLSLGATANNIDLSQFKVQKINLQSGASDIYLKIGSLYHDVKVDIESGASSIDIKIPKTMNCHIIDGSVLSSKSYIGFTKEDKNSYISKVASEESKGNIEINIESGVSSISVSRY